MGDKATNAQAVLDFIATLPDDSLVQCEVWRYWSGGGQHEFSSQVSAQRFKDLADNYTALLQAAKALISISAFMSDDAEWVALLNAALQADATS